MRIYFLGMIPSMIYNMGSGILRSMGDSRRPLQFLAVCAVVNIVLDLVFVLVLQMAVIGVAVANAVPGCLAAADRITGSNDEDGVAHVVEEFIL